MKARRPERILDFDNQTLQSLPEAKGYSDVWYDRTQPYLLARGKTTISGRVLYQGKSSFLVHAGKVAIRGAQNAGVRLGRYTRITGDTIEEVRENARLMHEKIEQYRASGDPYRRKARSSLDHIPDGRTNTPEDILKEHPSTEDPNYDKLMSVLLDAYQQASAGKGNTRHDNGLDFEDQDMMQVMDRVGVNFALGQAIKKLTEGRRLRKSNARDEFLGAIIYIAGAVVWMDKEEE